MNKSSFFQGALIALFCLLMTSSFGQMYLPVKGTSSAVWDDAHNRYLFTYQDISKDIMGKPVYNEIYIFQCGRDGKNILPFTDLYGKLFAATGMFISGNKLYVADWTKIWVINLTDGTQMDSINAPGKCRFQDITWDGVDTLYATDIADNKIWWFSMSTKAFDTLAVDTNGVNTPTGIYYEESPKRSLFICSFINNSPIQRWDFSGDSLYTIKKTSYKFCYGITGDGKGNYYLSDWRTTALNGGAVYKFVGGWNKAVTYVDYMNFPANIIYQPLGDTLVVPELNSKLKTLRLVPANKDIVPPLVDTAIVVSTTKILVDFNEQVNATATMSQNYSGVGAFTSVTINAARNEVTLILAKALIPNYQTNLSISDVQDMAGNAMKQPRVVNVTYILKSIYDNYIKGGLTVYPNPVKNKLNIDYELLQTAPVSIELFDMLGKKVADFLNESQSPGEYQLSYQLPKTITNNGLYIMKFTVDGQIFMSKILVSR